MAIHGPDICHIFRQNPSAHPSTNFDDLPALCESRKMSKGKARLFPLGLLICLFLVSFGPVFQKELFFFIKGLPFVLKVNQKLIVCRFDLQREARPVRKLTLKYRDQPMDLADACLVRLYETHREGTATIVTVNRTDFTVYRTSKGKPLRCEFPPADR